MLERIKEWDHKTVKRLYFHAKEKKLTEMARKISYFGDPRLWGILDLILGIYGIMVLDFTYVVLFVSSFFQSYLIYYIIKQSVKRQRPFTAISEIERMDKTGHGHGFPSGHSHHSTILVGMLWLVFFPKLWILPLILIYCVIIGSTRLMTGCHYPSDVIVGIIEAYIELIFYWFVTKQIYILIYTTLFRIVFQS